MDHQKYLDPKVVGVGILEKESELQVIHQENQDLKEEIELLKNNEDHIKKIAEEDLGLIKNDEEKPLLNLNENPVKSQNNSEQISLLDIDENEKRDNLDDVLEIPAFLRRQAN